MYEYNAIVRRVVDGDTVILDVDLGFETWKHNVRCRLAGIDTPERGQPGYQGAKDVLDTRLTKIMHGCCVIEVQKAPDGWGRWVVTIYDIDDSLKMMSVNDWMVQNGYADKWEK